LRICWRRQKERRMPAGRHGHKIREYKRRIDALLEAQRERRRPLSPPPPPINEEHAALRRQIAEALRALFDDPEAPEGLLDIEDPDLIEWFEETFDERAKENPELDNILRKLIRLQREECTLLAKNGVDYRPYEVYQLE
jgi:succinate dehydrogenase flavin-adding protein (antitoxin of CptAB toxin-antitoxin module)